MTRPTSGMVTEAEADELDRLYAEDSAIARLLADRERWKALARRVAKARHGEDLGRLQLEANTLLVEAEDVEAGRDA